jgi:hypothetical protein
MLACGYQGRSYVLTLAIMQHCQQLVGVSHDYMLWRC